MSVFGVTYVHCGSWRDPIVELLGRQTSETVFEYAQGTFFSREADAVRHVRALARMHADAAIAERKRFLARSSDQVRLGAARHLPSLRSRYSSLLSEDEVTSRKEASALKLLKNGFTPRILKVAEKLRFPRVLQLDAEVFVVDYRNFLTRPVKVRGERIEERTIVPAKGGVYDAVVRYRITNIPGLTGYDTTDPEVNRLTRYAPGVEIFISRKRAERFVGQLVERIEKALEPMREEAGLMIAVVPDVPPMKEARIRLITSAEDSAMQVPIKVGNVH